MGEMAEDSMGTPTDVPREPADWRLRFVLAMLVFILGLAIGRGVNPYLGGCVSYVGYRIMERTSWHEEITMWTIHGEVAAPWLIWVVVAVGFVLWFVLAG